MRLSVLARIYLIAILVGIIGDNCMNMTCCAESSATGYVHKKILNNGLTVLVRSSHAIPKVCVELWYKVGSKNEKTDQKGIAHLIEHMVFKGTTGQSSLNLSESDINVIVHTLSGSCNAFTSYDYTGYLFNFPTHHWPMSLKIVADCMKNCAFKEEHLNSEMKAVIQELKMYKDNYVSYLVDEMLASIFAGHPYHDPVIGYKHNLWSFHAKDLKNFYEKHYVPNNAVLVVVGDVEPEEVFALAEQEFGDIPADYSYDHESFQFTPDIVSKDVTLYRDIQQPVATSVYIIPGSSAGKDSIVDVISWILGDGKSSRLQRRLVDELQLVTSLAVYHVDLFDHALFGILFEPKNVDDITGIHKIIQEEIDDLVRNGFKPGELERAVKNAQVRLYDTFQDLQQQATDIGKYYLATGNPDYIFTYLQEPLDVIGKDVIHLCSQYMRAAVMHKGLVLPITETEKKHWVTLQEESDAQDNVILSSRERDSSVEPANYAKNVTVAKSKDFKFPRARKILLENGSTLLYCQNSTTPKIDVLIDFKMRYYADPGQQQGLCNFMNRLVMEGTTHYTARELADALESHGISCRAFPGGISLSMLKTDFHYGLGLLREILEYANFNPESIEKVREQILSDIKSFWDEPSSFVGQLVRNIIYKGHPYSSDALGCKESIMSITRDDIVDCYKKCITPDGMRIAIVGDLEGIDTEQSMKNALGSWRGNRAEETTFPSLETIKAHEIDYPINRDQIVLCIAGLSVSRTDDDFDRLYLFDQIFGSGVLGSMASRLFQLREQSGLFYTIQGGVTVQSNEQPGMVFIKTIVSLDRLKEAQQLLRELIDTVADSIEEYELQEAKRAILNALVGNFETNFGTAKSFIFLDKYNFSDDYFDVRASMIEPITVNDVQQAVKKVLRNDRLITLRIGRV